MGVSVPLLIATWLLAQQAGSGSPNTPAGEFDLEGREFSAQNVGTAAFLNVGPVPITSDFQSGAGTLSLVASERIGAGSATFGDQAELSATLRIGIDEIRIELIQAGFPPEQSLSEEQGSGPIPQPPNGAVNGGVRVGGWVHGSTEAGFLWGGRAPAAFSVYGFGRVFVNGQLISERAVIQAHALSAGRFSDDARHLLQPSLRPEDLEVQVIATGLPRSIVPGGFVELHYDEVAITTPEGRLADASPLAGAVGTRPELVVPEGFRPGGLVFNLPPELPGVGGSGVVDTSGSGLEGSGPVFGTNPTEDERGFLSGTGPAFGTAPAVGDRRGAFSGEGPIFDPEASPNIGGGATGIAAPAEERATGERPGTVQELTADTRRDEAVPEPARDPIALPGSTGPITPGTPVRGRLVGDQQVLVGAEGTIVGDQQVLVGAQGTVVGGVDSTAGSATGSFENFGPGVNTETFGPGNAAPFGPGASREVFGPGGLSSGTAGTSEVGATPLVTAQEGVFPGVPESTPGVPQTPFSLNSATDIPQRTTPLNATPAVPRVQTVTPLNAQPATPLLQGGVTPLNAFPAGATPPPVGTGVPSTPAPATTGGGATPGTTPGAAPSATPGGAAGPGGATSPGPGALPVAPPSAPVAPSGG